MIAAILLRVPTLAFEPNAVPGLANRLIGKRVSAAAVNFDETRHYFRNARVTGIPVRPDFFEIPRYGTFELAPSRELRLLVFGGSQGARVFNAVMPKIARQLLDDEPHLTILHQSGARAGEATAEAYQASGADAKRWRVREFLDDMPKHFAAADLILCRSGASTAAEVAAAGRAALMVPFPGAADDHQLKNAEAFKAAGAAELRVQHSDDLMANLLLSDLSDLLHNPERRADMARKARILARPNALRDIAQLVVSLAMC